MGDDIQVQKGNIRVEFSDLEDKNNTGVWAVSFSIHRKKIIARRELEVWSHWFTMPTKLKLSTSHDQVRACGEKLISTLEYLDHLLPQEEKDFGSNAEVNSILLSQLTDITEEYN